MQYLVVAYPRLDATDARWVQALRQQYDPHAALIAPHFTLVFPTGSADARRFLLDLRQQATPFAPFTVVIRCALPVKDLLSPSTHIFLVPDEGLSTLVRLHDALYATSLAPALRLDIPFLPHITVGAIGEPAVAKAIADGEAVMEQMHVTLEVGPKGKKVVAVATDWPGLGRPHDYLMNSIRAGAGVSR